MKKAFRKWGLLLAGLLVIAGFYAAMALYNSNRAALPARLGALACGENAVRPCIVTGEWYSAEGLYDPQTAESADFRLIDISRVGEMANRTYRFRLTLDDTSLCFTLARPRGSRLWLNGREVLGEDGASPQTDQIFSFAPYAAEDSVVDALLQVPPNSYFYSGYQGMLVGAYSPLNATIRTRMLVEAACLGACFALLAICLLLFSQKREEKYLLLLAGMIVMTAFRLLDYSAFFADSRFIHTAGDVSRLSVFFPYLLCRHFSCVKRPILLDRLVLAMAAAALFSFFALRAQYASVCDAINLLLIVLEGTLIFNGVRQNRHGLIVIAFGWMMYGGMDGFYRLLSAGVIHQGIVDVLIKPMQYAHVSYMFAFALSVFEQVARKYCEADHLAAVLEAKVAEQVEEIQKYSDDVVRQQKERQQFMTDLVHNLRNPLFALGGYMDMLEDETDETGRKKYLNLMNRKLEYMGRMVDEMLLISRLENRQITIDKTLFPLRDFLENVRTDALPKAAEAALEIDCAAVNACADQYRLRQALDNLVDNALTHGNGSRIVLRGFEQDGMTVLQVEDNGKGIPEQELPHLFKRYYRGSKGKSVGLGLSISREIVLLHQGTITLESAPGKGTTVTIRLSA